MNTTSFVNSHGRKVLEYIQPDTILLELPFIMTRSGKLVLNTPYMLMEGHQPRAVRLLEVRDEDGVVCLDVRELLTGRTYTLSWNMEYSGDYWLWSLTDLSTLYGLTK